MDAGAGAEPAPAAGAAAPVDAVQREPGPPMSPPPLPSHRWESWEADNPSIQTLAAEYRMLHVLEPAEALAELEADGAWGFLRVLLLLQSDPPASKLLDAIGGLLDVVQCEIAPHTCNHCFRSVDFFPAVFIPDAEALPCCQRICPECRANGTHTCPAHRMRIEPEEFLARVMADAPDRSFLERVGQGWRTVSDYATLQRLATMLVRLNFSAAALDPQGFASNMKVLVFQLSPLHHHNDKLLAETYKLAMLAEQLASAGAWAEPWTSALDVLYDVWSPAYADDRTAIGEGLAWLEASLLSALDRLPGEQSRMPAGYVFLQLANAPSDPDLAARVGSLAIAVMDMNRSDPLWEHGAELRAMAARGGPDVSEERPLRFAADRWGDGVDEDEVEFDGVENPVLRLQLAAFAGSRREKKQAPKAIAKHYEERIAAAPMLGEELSSARSLSLRAVIAPPGSAARAQMLRRAILCLSPAEPSHADLLGLLLAHYDAPGDLEVRFTTQLLLLDMAPLLRPRHVRLLRERLLRLVPIVNMCGPLRRALNEGRATLEMVRRAELNAELRGEDWTDEGDGLMEYLYYEGEEEEEVGDECEYELGSGWIMTDEIDVSRVQLVRKADGFVLEVPGLSFVGCWPWPGSGGLRVS